MAGKKKVVTSEQRLSRLMRIRTELLLDEPFFGNLTLRLQFKEDTGCKTFWVDGVSLGYNPALADTLTDAELKGVLCHEVMHVAAGHPWRRKGRQPKRWNEACDYAINPLIKSFRFVLPSKVLLDPKYQGKAAEQIYIKLQQDEEQQSAKQDKGDGDASPETGEGEPAEGEGKPQPDKGDEPAEGDGESQPAGGDEPAEGDGESQPAGGDEPAEGDGEPQPAEGGKPAEGDGKPQPAKGGGEAQPDDEPATGEVRDCPKGKGDELEETWRQAAVAAMKMARAKGKMPGSLEQFVNDSVKPKVDWKEVLRRFIQQAFTSQDYSWKQPNRSFLAQGLYMPALRGEKLPCIVAACDTSGSCLQDLPAFYAELKSIFEDVMPEEMFLLTCDVRVTEVLKLHEGDELRKSFKGGGGTSFVPVFNWIDAEGLTPTCLIYLTDTWGDFPAVEPDYPVLWVHPKGVAQAPWGELVEIAD